MKPISHAITDSLRAHERTHPANRRTSSIEARGEIRRTNVSRKHPEIGYFFENQMHADQFAEEQDARDERPEAVGGDGIRSGAGSDPKGTDGQVTDPLSSSAFIPHPASLRRRASGSARGSEFIEKSGNRAGHSSTEAATGADSDEALFLLYRDGNERAFLTIYDRYKESIYAYCSHVLLSVGLTREIVEDTFQEVFMRVAQYQHTFNGGEFKAWIFTVTRHSCLSTKKRAFRSRAMTEYIGDGENFNDTTSNELRMAFSMNDDPLERMAKTEQTELLLKAIASLPEEFREALLMSEYEGLTYDEIGKITGTSLSTIRIRIYRAKARLRKMLLPILGDETDRLINLPDTNEK